MALNVYLTITVIDASRASSEVFVPGKLIVMFIHIIKAIITKGCSSFTLCNTTKTGYVIRWIDWHTSRIRLPSTAVTLQRTSRKSMYLMEDCLHEILSQAHDDILI